MSDDEPVYLLSLDGGGIRGISELVILHTIMKRLQDVAGFKHLPKPRDYFHLIGGTSTGGLIAILLGRMNMTTLEAIECYETFAKRVFRRSNRRRFKRTFNEKTLEKAIRDIVAEKKLETTVMIDERRGDDLGRAFVCAVPRSSMDEPYLFRTYRGESNHAHNVEIWEAARATSAAPGFFDPIEIKIEATKGYYCDGALAHNNPAKLVLDEADFQLGSSRKLGFLLSLGTGLKRGDEAVVMKGDTGSTIEPAAQTPEPSKRNLSGSLFSRDSFPLFEHMKMKLTDPEGTHRELEQWFRDVPNAYFRLNLNEGAANIGLDEYKKMGLLREATEKYLLKDDVSATIDRIVSLLHDKEGAEMPLEATCRATSYEAFKNVMVQDARNRVITSPQFVGRTAILDKLDQHFWERKPGSSPRRLLRIWGMGGVGKTQIALKFRDMHGSRFGRVFWINAASTDSIFESFRKVTVDIYGGNPSKPNVEGVLKWLSANPQEEWLLIFDNNDTDSVDVSKYIPEGDTGNILFTSRRKDTKPSLDRDQTYAVDIMDEADAKKLLLRAAKLGGQPLYSHNDQQAMQIVKELGYLPLAIDQAGSYIDVQECTFEQYLFELRTGRKELMEDPSMGRGAFQDNPAVYGTFELSYKALKKKSTEDTREGRAALNAIRILCIFCFYHNESLTAEIMNRAALYNRFDTQNIGGGAGSIAPLPLLQREESGEWDCKPFASGISVLRSYSLIKDSALNKSCYSMHILVHSWARDRMDPRILAFQRRAAREILFFTIYRRRGHSDERWASIVLPHLRACVEHEGTENIEYMRRTEQEGKFAGTLILLGLWQDAVKYWEWITWERQQILGPADWATILAMWDLAKAYRDWGRLKKAEDTFEHIKARLQDCKNKDGYQVFKIFVDLATVYVLQARYLDAKALLTGIIEEEEELGWKSQAYRHATVTLATVLRMLDDKVEALSMELFILRKCRDSPDLDSVHGMMMTSMSNVSILHSELGFHEEADKSYRELLDIIEEWRDANHPSTLQAKRHVATGRANLGKLWEAEDILREVLEASEKALGKDHLDTLTTMDQLAGVLVRRGKHEEAEQHWTSCLEGRKIWLGDGHPLTDRTRKALSHVREGAMMLAQEDFGSDGFLQYGDSNFVSQAERDVYLY